MRHLRRSQNRLQNRSQLSLPLRNLSRQSLLHRKRNKPKRRLKSRRPQHRNLNRKLKRPKKKRQNQLRNLQNPNLQNHSPWNQNLRQSLPPRSLPQSRQLQNQVQRLLQNQEQHARATILSKPNKTPQRHALAHAVGGHVRGTTRSPHNRACVKNAVEAHVPLVVERRSQGQVKALQRQDLNQVKSLVRSHSSHASLAHAQHQQ